MVHVRAASIAIATLLALVSQGKSSVNLNSFAKASAAKIDFRATPIRATQDCSSMASTAADGVRIISSEMIAANGSVPAHCRINGFIPTEVGFQINLPVAWNGRLYMYGNGGFAGEDAEAPNEKKPRDTALSNGFATVRTDTGHLASKEPLGTFAVDHAKVIDHGYRAVHETRIPGSELRSKDLRFRQGSAAHPQD
jgi:feruloyl esterase